MTPEACRGRTGDRPSIHALHRAQLPSVDRSPGPHGRVARTPDRPPPDGALFAPIFPPNISIHSAARVLFRTGSRLYPAVPADLPASLCPVLASSAPFNFNRCWINSGILSGNNLLWSQNNQCSKTDRCRMWEYPVLEFMYSGFQNQACMHFQASIWISSLLNGGIRTFHNFLEV